MEKLTYGDCEILLHRLSVPDAIIDALTDVENPPFTEDQIADSIQKLEGDIKEDGYLQSDYGNCDKAVLEDLIDGSTWYGCAIHEVTPQRLGQMLARGNALAEKVSRVIGRTVRFPAH